MFALTILQVALAHGPPAAVTGVAAADAAGPAFVPLTEGMAVRGADGWRYTCPTRWGGSPIGPLAGGDPGEVRIPGADDLYALDPAGVAAPLGYPELAISGVLGLVDAGGVWALYTAGVGREVWRLDGEPERIWSDPGGWSGLAAGPDGVELVRALDGELERMVVGTGERTVEGPVAGASPLIRIAGGRRFVVDRASDGQALLEVPGLVPVAEAVDAIAGPVEAGGRLWVAVDGLLHELPPGGPAVRAPADANVACLVARPEGAWACARTLAPLLPDGALGEPVFALEALLPPIVTDLADDDAVACWGAWRTWALDVGVDPGDMPGPTTGPPDPPPDGCGCAHGSRPVGWPLLAILAAIAHRRGRERS